MEPGEFFVIDSWTHIAYRKTRDEFLIPVDHVAADAAVLERVRHAFAQQGE